MIPLLKPEFPNLKAVEKIFSTAYRKRVFTNFGDLFYECVKQLSNLMNGEALPVTSGTTAISAALATMNAKGKRVAMPDYTHSGTLLGIIQAQANPVLFGVETDSWIISLNDLKKHSDKYDMVVVVSPFGYEVNFDEFEEFSVKHKKPIVYDLAGCFGNFRETINPRCYSFHATKNFSVGEGGCVVLPDTKMWFQAQKIINFGTNLDRSLIGDTGANWKVDELRCALILAMLQPESFARVERKVNVKNALLDFYESETKKYVPPGAKHTSLCVLGGFTQKKIEEQMFKKGIQVKPYYPLLSKMPSLAHIDRVTTSPPDMETCVALPSDVLIHEAYSVVQSLNDLTP
jgi:dTDP-4-amino-4,6-dideoxygalactose transaminase